MTAASVLGTIISSAGSTAWSAGSHDDCRYVFRNEGALDRTLDLTVLGLAKLRLDIEPGRSQRSFEKQALRAELAKKEAEFLMRNRSFSKADLSNAIRSKLALLQSDRFRFQDVVNHVEAEQKLAIKKSFNEADLYFQRIITINDTEALRASFKDFTIYPFLIHNPEYISHLKNGLLLQIFAATFAKPIVNQQSYDLDELMRVAEGLNNTDNWAVKDQLFGESANAPALIRAILKNKIQISKTDAKDGIYNGFLQEIFREGSSTTDLWKTLSPPDEKKILHCFLDLQATNVTTILGVQRRSVRLLQSDVSLLKLFTESLRGKILDRKIEIKFGNELTRFDATSSLPDPEIINLLRDLKIPAVSDNLNHYMLDGPSR